MSTVLRFLPIASCIARVTFAVAATCIGASHAFAAYTLTNVADVVTAIPGGGTFTDFSPPAISGSTVAFYANYSGAAGSQGIFTASAGTVTAVVRNGVDTPIAPGSIRFSGFGNPGISGTTVIFQGFSTDEKGTSGIFTGSNGTLSTLARDMPKSAPEGGTFRSFGVPAISNGNATFIASYTVGEMPKSGVFVSMRGTLSPVALTRTTTIPGGGTLTNLLAPVISGSTIAFLGFYSGGTGTQGIFTASGAALSLIVRNKANSVPGGGAFEHFGPPAISGTMVVFQATYSGGTGTEGIFTGSGSAVQSVATNGGTTSSAPGGGTFTEFGSAAVSGTTVAFQGTYNNGGQEATGIFISSKGKLTSVIRQGDPAFGSVVTRLSFGTFGLDGDRVAFGYRLANGKMGVAIASPGSATAPLH